MRVERGAPRDSTNSKIRGKIFHDFETPEEGEEERRKKAFLISRPKSFGLEDTTRRKIQLEAVKIGNILVELNHPIEICKSVCKLRSSFENVVSILLLFFVSFCSSIFF